MAVSIVAKVKIVPTEIQEILLLCTMKVYAEACDYVSDYIFKTKELNKNKINKALYHDVRKRFNLGAQMTQSVFRTVISKYKTILTNQEEWIQPSFRHPQCDLVWNRDYSLTKGKFSIGTIPGRIRVLFEMKGMEQYFNDKVWKFGTAKLVYKKNKFYLHIAVTNKQIEVKDTQLANVVGVDSGINFIATAYDDNSKTTFYSGRKIKHKRAKFAKCRKELQKRKTASARRRLKKIGNREHCWMQDVNHCVSKALVTKYPRNTLFVLENLTGIRSATAKVVLKERYVSVSWAFYDLRQKLEYKAPLLRDSMVITVDPAYTSQRCPKCGHTEKTNRNKKKHLFTCKKCGYRSNDDRVGAMNLYAEGIKYLSTVTAEHVPV